MPSLTGICVPSLTGLSEFDWLTCAAGGEQAGGSRARVDARAEDAAHVYTEQARRGGKPYRRPMPKVLEGS